MHNNVQYYNNSENRYNINSETKYTWMDISTNVSWDVIMYDRININIDYKHGTCSACYITKLRDINKK